MAWDSLTFTWEKGELPPGFPRLSRYLQVSAGWRNTDRQDILPASGPHEVLAGLGVSTQVKTYGNFLCRREADLALGPRDPKLITVPAIDIISSQGEKCSWLQTHTGRLRAQTGAQGHSLSHCRTQLQTGLSAQRQDNDQEMGLGDLMP